MLIYLHEIQMSTILRQKQQYKVTNIRSVEREKYMAETLVVDLGYFNLKMIDESGNVTIVQNAYVHSSENDVSIPLDSKTKKITLELKDPTFGTVKSTRIYGEKACQFSGHIQGIGSRKVEEIQFAFASVLSSRQNGKRLNVFCIHNEKKDFSLIKQSIIGTHKVRINDQEITCDVTSCECLPEGLGTYYQLKKTQPLVGSTRIIDLGFGLANDLILSETGEIQHYATKPELSVFTLAQIVQNSEIFQEYLKDYNSNLGSIAYALQKDQALGAMPKEEWSRLKSYSISQYYKKIKTYLTAPISNSSLFVNTYVLTGGGSAILDREHKAFKSVFTIPEDPHVASLIGILDHPAIKSKPRW